MIDPTARELIQRLADALETSSDDWTEHDDALFAEARAYLASHPEPVQMIDPEQQEIENQLATQMPEKQEKVNQFLITWMETDTDTDTVEEDVVFALRELVNQFGYTHPYLDGDHGTGVVNVSDINLVIEKFYNASRGNYDD